MMMMIMVMMMMIVIIIVVVIVVVIIVIIIVVIIIIIYYYCYYYYYYILIIIMFLLLYWYYDNDCGCCNPFGHFHVMKHRLRVPRTARRPRHATKVAVCFQLEIPAVVRINCLIIPCNQTWQQIRNVDVKWCQCFSIETSICFYLQGMCHCHAPEGRH